MHLEIFAIVETVIVFISVSCAVLIVRRVRKQILEMADVLEDVKNGNGNRRILSATNELVAPLAYAMNDIILSYENRLSAYHRTEETNRQLMTSLSHDAKTPLASLVGYLEAVTGGLVTGEEKEAYILIASEKAHQLKGFIESLFEWVKLDAGEQTYHFEQLDLNELTRSIIADWIPTWENSHFKYEIEIPETEYWMDIKETD